MVAGKKVGSRGGLLCCPGAYAGQSGCCTASESAEVRSEMRLIGGPRALQGSAGSGRAGYLIQDCVRVVY